MSSTTTQQGAPPRRRRLSARNRRDAVWFLALALPNLVLIALFTYRPLLTNVYYSMLDWTLGSANATFIGLGNYVEFFTSPAGLASLRITVVFTVVTVGGSMLLGLLLALMRTPEWMNDPTRALVMVLVVYVWKNLGYCAIVYLGGLQSLPRDVMQAAALDGAGPVRRFWSISLPLLSPTTFFLLITTILNSLQAFDILRIMTPTGRGTNALIFESYLQAFGGYSRAGYSAAISVVLFVMLIVITVVQIRFVEKKVHYA